MNTYIVRSVDSRPIPHVDFCRVGVRIGARISQFFWVFFVFLQV